MVKVEGGDLQAVSMWRCRVLIARSVDSNSDKGWVESERQCERQGVC